MIVVGDWIDGHGSLLACLLLLGMWSDIAVRNANVERRERWIDAMLRRGLRIAEGSVSTEALSG